MNDLPWFINVQHCSTLLIKVQHCWSLTYSKNEWSTIVQPCSTLLINDMLNEWVIYQGSSMFNIVKHCWSLTYPKNEWSTIVQKCSTLLINVQHSSTLWIIDLLKEWMIYHGLSMFNIVQHCWSLTYPKYEWSIIIQQCSTLFNIDDHWHT